MVVPNMVTAVMKLSRGEYLGDGSTKPLGIITH